MRTLALIAVAAMAGAPAVGAPITITHQGTGAGTLDGVAFGPSDFTITAHADTDLRMSYINGFWIRHTSATIEINGLGTFDFVTSTQTYVSNTAQRVGFSRLSPGRDLFDGPTDAVFAVWDMLTSLGPISGDGILMQWDDAPISTSSGTLSFATAVSDATFEARVVPAPATLVPAGAIGIAGIGRRRRTRGARWAP